MRFLLDLHSLIWALADTARLPRTARDLIGDAANEVLCSAAGIWTIAIRARLGRVNFAFEPERILVAGQRAGWQGLPVTAAAALRSTVSPCSTAIPSTACSWPKRWRWAPNSSLATPPSRPILPWSGSSDGGWMDEM